MIFIKKINREIVSGDNPYWMSFSDMMSGMLIIFILLCITLLFKLSKMEEEVYANIKELERAHGIRSEILQEISTELKVHGIKVEISDNDTVLRIPESAFHFETGSYTITDNMRQTAEQIGRSLYTAIAKEQRWRELETVFVEGHTDSRRALSYRMDNWELSALRAISLWQFWINRTDYGDALQKLTNREGKHLFSVSGYAATRRAEEMEISEEAMLKNRRIDIRITTRQPSIMEIQDTIKPISK